MACACSAHEVVLEWRLKNVGGIVGRGLYVYFSVIATKQRLEVSHKITPVVKSYAIYLQSLDTVVQIYFPNFEVIQTLGKIVCHMHGG